MKTTVSPFQKIALFLISLFASLFILFVLFEIFPEIPSRLNLTSLHYYALKERYVKDPDLVLRIKPYYSYKGLFTGDIRGLFSKSSFKPLPYQADYDKNGFRNRHGENKTDLMVLGDSYMEVGLTNEDTFASYLEEKSGFTTANYGMGWYGPYQYLEVLKRYGKLNRPDIVLFSFFEGNDLKDILVYQKWREGGEYYHFNRYYGNIFQRFGMCLKDIAVKAAKLFVRRWDPRRADIQLGPSAFHTVFVYPVDSRNTEELKRSSEIEQLRGILQEFKKHCEQNGIRPVFLFIPSKAHVYLPYASMPAMPKDRLNAQIENRGKLEEAVRQTVEETQISWISLTPLFETLAKEGDFLYYETDTHWNTKGRIAAAAQVAASLKTTPETADPQTPASSAQA